jgi:predicted dehydrogenase
MHQFNRRQFLKSSAALSGSVILSPFAIGQAGPSANSKLNIAMVGSGGIARTCFRECAMENLVAIAEVDDVAGAEGLEKFPRAKRYKDFRKMLDAHAHELDLVIINTPDHTHFPATYAAMERGIAVHTQKPLTHNIWQARTLQKAYHKFGVQTVMGNQGHNMQGMKLIREWYEAGLLGEVREVHAWTGRTTTNNTNAKIELPAEPVPATLDWDQWLGPAEHRPYSSEICPKNWRWHWEYGLGGLGDIGCHTLDIPTYALGLGYPTSVKVDNSLNFRREFDGNESKEDATTYIYEFPARPGKPPVTVYWYEGGNLPQLPASLKNVNDPGYVLRGGCLLVGDQNTLHSPGMRPTSPKLVMNWEDIRRGGLPPKTLPRAVGDPVEEIIAALKGEVEKCGSNFDYAVPLTETVLLGTIANRSGKVVEYQPETMDFKDPSLNQYIKEPVRKGWEYGEGLL